MKQKSKLSNLGTPSGATVPLIKALLIKYVSENSLPPARTFQMQTQGTIIESWRYCTVIMKSTSG